MSMLNAEDADEPDIQLYCEVVDCIVEQDSISSRLVWVPVSTELCFTAHGMGNVLTAGMRVSETWIYDCVEFYVMQDVAVAASAAVSLEISTKVQ